MERVWFFLTRVLALNEESLELPTKRSFFSCIFTLLFGLSGPNETEAVKKICTTPWLERACACVWVVVQLVGDHRVVDNTQFHSTLSELKLGFLIFSAELLWLVGTTGIQYKDWSPVV